MGVHLVLLTSTARSPKPALEWDIGVPATGKGTHAARPAKGRCSSRNGFFGCHDVFLLKKKMMSFTDWTSKEIVLTIQTELFLLCFFFPCAPGRRCKNENLVKFSLIILVLVEQGRIVCGKKVHAYSRTLLAAGAANIGLLAWPTSKTSVVHVLPDRFCRFGCHCPLCTQCRNCFWMCSWHEKKNRVQYKTTEQLLQNFYTFYIGLTHKSHQVVCGFPQIFCC